MNVALRYPDRVLGLVLSRPAWIDRPLPENVRSLLDDRPADPRARGPRKGSNSFATSPEFQAMERESPDCARSLVGQFEQPRAEECVARLERLAVDTPVPIAALYGNLKVPTLDPGQSPGPDPSVGLWPRRSPG